MTKEHYSYMADHLLSSQNLDGGVHGGGHNACGLAQIASHLGALNVHQMLLDEVVAEADSAPDSAKELCLDPPSRKSYAVTASQASLMMYW
jgi:hypothetical protein